jgi:hypothetical protein
MENGQERQIEASGGRRPIPLLALAAGAYSISMARHWALRADGAVLMDAERLDLTSDPQDAESATAPRNYVGIHFTCCGVYARVYVNREGTAYAGHCPRCAKSVRLRIGPGGTDSRFFRAE